MSIEKLISRRSVGMIDPIGDLQARIGEITATESMSSPRIGEFSVSTESLDSSQSSMLSNTYNNIETAIKAISSSLSEDGKPAFESFQIEAATLAGMLATNPAAFFKQKLRSSDQEAVPMNAQAANATPYRPKDFGIEAYNESENRNAQMQSIVFNLLSARQDEVGETFFPTIIVNPNEVGVSVSVNLFYIYNDFKRDIDGSLASYNRRNLVRAYADPTILNNELTRCIPVFRNTGTAGDGEYNADKFVPGLNPWSVNLGNGVSVDTSALLVNQKVDLMGLSSTAELLRSGFMGPSDVLDTHLKLEELVLEVGSQLAIVKVGDLVGATFNHMVQGNYRNMMLQLDSNSLVIDENLVDANTGAALTDLSLAGRNVRLEVSIGGRVSLDKGDCQINQGTISLVTAEDAVTGLTLPTADLAALEAELQDVKIVGYNLTAFRANANIRQRGALIDTQTEFRLITVPWRSPVTSIAPAIQSAQDSTVMQTLVTTNGIRVSNDAVTALLDARDKLSRYIAVPDASGSLPELDILGQFYLKPVFLKESITMTDIVDSIKSSDRIKDIRAAIVEKMRWYANQMYVMSEYPAAANVLLGNKAAKPTIIIATDPVIHNYLTFDGDLRTFGENFEVKIVSNIDVRLQGKAFMAFGVFDSNRNTSLNPLNFGNMLYSPELAVNMPVARDGQVSHELMVSPRYIHAVTCPILAELDLSDLGLTVDRIPYLSKVLDLPEVNVAEP